MRAHHLYKAVHTRFPQQFQRVPQYSKIALAVLCVMLTACTTQVRHHHVMRTVVENITPTSQDAATLSPSEKEDLHKHCTDLVKFVEAQQYIELRIGHDAFQHNVPDYQQSFPAFAHKHFSFVDDKIAMDIAYRSIGHANDLLLHQDVKNYCSNTIFYDVMKEDPDDQLKGWGNHYRQSPNWATP